jgi:hypothetical protein
MAKSNSEGIVSLLIDGSILITIAIAVFVLSILVVVFGEEFGIPVAILFFIATIVSAVFILKKTLFRLK